VGISSPSLVCPINTNDVHPTYFRTNKFTFAFQMLVDSYGVAVYKEVNPAPYGVITFPFLFSVMFGDACHGVLVLAFALFLVTKEKMLEKSSAAKNEVGELCILIGYGSIFF
jgi:V-type H+-transporting ATPase subunit a